jgi:hypothetical protein
MTSAFYLFFSTKGKNKKKKGAKAFMFGPCVGLHTAKTKFFGRSDMIDSEPLSPRRGVLHALSPYSGSHHTRDLSHFCHCVLYDGTYRLSRTRESHGPGGLQTYGEGLVALREPDQSIPRNGMMSIKKPNPNSYPDRHQMPPNGNHVRSADI